MSDVPLQVRATLSALQFQGRRTEGLHTLSHQEWNDLLSRWEFHRCLVPLRLTCGEDLPEWVRLQIDRRLQDNTIRLERIKNDYSQFSSELRRLGASHVVIKGFTLWPGFVDHPRFRLQSDIDVYCPPEAIVTAREALMELGYEPEKGENFGLADHLPSMVRKSPWKWDGNFYDPEMPISFELHHSFWNERAMRIRPSGLDQFWVRRIERQLDGITFPALSELDTFGYAALHLVRNMLHNRPSAYQIYELARFLHLNAGDQQFWEDWRATHDESLRRLEVIACLAAARCFACRLPEEMERDIAGLPATVEAWFDRFATVLVCKQFHPTKDLLWLHTSLVESLGDKLSIICEGLLPTRLPSLGIVDLLDVARPEQRGAHTLLGRLARFIAYLFSHLPFQLRMVPATLWSGVGFWWSTQGLGEQFWRFFAISFLFDLGMFIFFFLYNIFLLDRGFREDFIGLTASANTIGSVVICIPSAILAQRAGLQKTLLICLVFSALFAGALAFVTSKQAILVLSFLLGAASTIWAVAIAPATARLTNDKNREIGFSLIFSSGIAVGLLGSVTASRMPGWLAHIYQSIGTVHAKQATLLVGSAVVAIAAWPAFRLHFDLPAPEKKTYPLNAFLFRFLLVVAVWSLAAGVLTPFYTVYFSQYLHLGLERIGIVTSISQVSQALAILAAPFIVKKYGLVPGIVYMQLATAISLGWLAAAHTVPTAVALYIAYTSLQWMSEPAIYSLLMGQVAPAEQAGASALNFLVISLVQAFASAAAGASFLRFGYPAVLGATAVVALASAILFQWVLGQKIKKVAETETRSLSLH
jgi:MFS family permease